MKNSIIQHTFLFLALAIFCIGYVYAQDECKVLLEDIAGQYEGDCKKGLAEGKGTAKGTDTYVGDFKKGLPHGTGTYTWANGDIYIGEFKKGLKDGAGKITVSLLDGGKKEQTGFWLNDEYIGENKSPYEVTYKSPEVLSVRINETDNTANDGNALFIEIQHQGRVQQAPEFGLTTINGSFQNRFMVGNTTKILVSRFPFGFSISYMGETVELQIYQEKSWNIQINYNK